jgi:hypothetical protein
MRFLKMSSSMNNHAINHAFFNDNKYVCTAIANSPECRFE